RIDKCLSRLEKDVMTKEQIPDAIAQKPFKPFWVRLADGMEIAVPTGDHVRSLFISRMAAPRLSTWRWSRPCWFERQLEGFFAAPVFASRAFVTLTIKGRDCAVEGLAGGCA